MEDHVKQADFHLYHAILELEALQNGAKCEMQEEFYRRSKESVKAAQLIATTAYTFNLVEDEDDGE